MYVTNFNFRFCRNASWVGSVGARTRLGVRGDNSKCQILRLSVEAALFAFDNTAYGNGNGDQQGTTSLSAADLLITNVSKHFKV